MNSDAFSSKTRSVLQKPLLQRCEDIEKIIEDSSTKDLHGFFPQLLGSIFGYNGSTDWGFQSLQHHSRESCVLRAFLSPKGSLFKLVDKLQADGFLRYEFFIRCLPVPTQNSLAEGVIPALYHNKVQARTTGKNQHVVSLNAFEYFLFHFAYYIVYQQKSKETVGTDYPYIHILEEYLQYFLPTDGSPIQTSTKSSPAVGTVGRTSTWQEPNLYSRTHYHQSQFTGLIKAGPSGLINPPGVHHHGTFDHSSQETWRSEVFVQVLIEFWLNQNTMDSVTSNVLSHGQEYFMPSVDHVRVVRMLVKHIHSFAYTNGPDLHSQPVLNPTDDLKRNIIPRLLQRNLYCFLRHGFAHWPLDPSFRVILETWLSYIQPWRYTKASSGTSGQESVETAGPKWKSFLMDNFMFYTTLLLEFISRACRLDLRSAKDAHLLLRGTKVFAQQDLADMIEEGEKLLVVHSGAHPRSYAPSGVAAAASALRIHVTELEGPSYFYRPIFQRPGIDKIEELCLRVATALAEINSPQQSRPTHVNTVGLVEWVKGIFAGNFLDDEDDQRRTQEHKLATFLNQASQNLCSLNKGGRDVTDSGDKTIPWGSPDAPGLSTRPTLMSGPKTPGAQAALPDSFDTQRGLVPTPLGKYQMINGLRKFDVTYSGDPELQPIRSFENASLVRLLYRLSTVLNEEFGQTLEHVCNRSAFFHSATCHLCPALKAASQTAVLGSPVTRVQSPQGTLCPRISLRFLASYQTLIYLLFFYLFCRLLSLDSLLLLPLFILVLFTLVLHHMTPAYGKDMAYRKKVL